MTGFRVSRQLVILPILVLLLFLWTPKTGLAYSYSPLIKCNYEGVTPLICYNATSIVSSIDTGNPINGLASAYATWDSSTKWNRVGFNNPLNVSSSGFSVAFQIDPQNSGDSWYLEGYLNYGSGQSLPFTSDRSNIWANDNYSDEPYWVIGNFSPTALTWYNNDTLWLREDMRSSNYGYIDFSTTKPNNFEFYSGNWPITYDDFQVYDHILTSNERQELILTGNVTDPILPIAQATSTIDVDFNNYVAQQSWVDLTGDCEPTDANTLVYVYQGTTPDLPSDHYNATGIQQGISDFLFHSYAEPCDSSGRWHRIVFLADGQNYFTTYTRQQDFGSTSWVSTSHSNTVKVISGMLFDFHLTYPAGSDSLIGSYPLRIMDKKTYYDSSGAFTAIGYFDSGALLDSQASFRLDEVSSSGYLISTDKYSNTMADLYKTACANYPQGCIYGFQIPFTAIGSATGTRFFKLNFSNDNNFTDIFDVQYFALTITDDDNDPDIDWGLPIDSSWSTTTQPYIPVASSTDTLSNKLDRFYLIYSQQNICGVLPVDANLLEALVRGLPIAMCNLAHKLIMPSKVSVLGLLNLGDSAKEAFPWSIPFLIFDSMNDSLDEAVNTSEHFNLPVTFYFNGATTTVDVTNTVYDNFDKIGDTELGWVFGGITFRDFSGVLMTAGAVFFVGWLAVKMANRKNIE